MKRKSAVAACICCLYLCACSQAAQTVPQSLPAGESASAVTALLQAPQQTEEDGFTSEPVPEEVQQRMLGKSYPENCDVPFEELHYLRMKHVGFDGQVHDGEMVVNKQIADHVLEVFQELYQEKYPIEKIVLIDEYDAVDEASMADNNTSAFCFRLVEGTAARSFHADGLAIDLNPLYNPYVKGDYVGPAAGAPYVDRTLGNPYYITAESLPYRLFTERGFSWGGDWDGLKDYQHFAYGE